jgi:iron(III) transport system ATP-binding protein
MTEIELDQVTKTYPASPLPVLSRVCLDVAQGEILALLAPSGSGKTTLLRVIAGFETPDAGTVRIHGNDARSLRPDQRGIGMVFQEGLLFPHLSVEQNVGFGLHRLSRTQQREKVGAIMEMMGLASFADRYPHELSGGQQQRVALARALAPAPTIMLLDEPFAHLDRNLRTAMQQEVTATLRRIGSTVIFVTHDHEEAFAVADRVAILNAGRLEQHDTPDVVYHLPATPFVAKFVGDADFIPGVVSSGEVTTELGNFPAPPSFSPGARVQMMIRPDDVDLLPASGGKTTIISRQFKGSENCYGLRLPSGHHLFSSQHSLAIYPIGARVDVKLTATHTVLFPEAIPERV